MDKKISSTIKLCLLTLDLFDCDNTNKSNNMANATASAASTPAATSETSTFATSESHTSTVTSEAAIDIASSSIPTAINANPRLDLSSIDECDKYFAPFAKLTLNLPDSEKNIYNVNYENFKNMSTEQTTKAVNKLRMPVLHNIVN
jgi:superfamily I DNA and RNA helicase